MDYDLLFARGEEYCIAAVINWDKRRSKIIHHYLDTKNFLLPYEQRSRHMKFVLMLEAWIGEILMYYRKYQHEKSAIVKFDISEEDLSKN